MWLTALFNPVARRDDSLGLKKRLIKKEAELGGRLFGEPDKGCRWEFFCLDERTWVWHEVRTDPLTGRKSYQTWRYDIRFDQIYKRHHAGADWQRLDLKEARSLKAAIKAYRQQVLAKLYPEQDWS